ncbi:MAG: hypothetical protein ACKVXR_14850 [Planctomycetota bacterium]
MTPPPARFDGGMGVVRARSEEEARSVAQALDGFLPKIAREIPDARRAITQRGSGARTLEVWVQEEPALYAFPSSTAYRDADGFFSDRLGRIHLRAGSDDVERTLVHELVHASLGSSWQSLPGTLEEGLCDVVASRLCPQSAARLRAGRLLAAALAIGGLDIEIQMPAVAGSEDHVSEPRLVQRILPAEGAVDDLDPLEVFRTRAGISSASIGSDRKKALYGLAFLVAERVIERRGIEGLHDLVLQAGPGDMTVAFLAAAELTRDPEDWRRALAAALGPAEIAELSRHHPGFLLTPPIRRPEREPIDRLARASRQE